MTMNQATTSSLSQRRMYARLLITLLVGMFIALVLVRALALAMDARPENFMSRVHQARAHLPEVARQAAEIPTVMFFGSSMVQAGFSPREFQAHLAEQGREVRAWNFGFGGLNPLYQDYLARRVRDQFVANDARLSLALIEFNPFQTTTRRRDGARPIDESYINILATDAEVLEILRSDVRRGVRMFNIRYLRDNVSAQMATFFFGQGLSNNRPPRTELEQDETITARFAELGPLLNERFEQEYPDYDGCDWCLDWLGGGTIAAERPADTLALFEELYSLQQNPHDMSNDLLQRIHRADIIDLHFDEELIRHFIALVRVFQTFSDEVQVVLLPRNTDWVVNPPEAQARLQAVIERIETETGLQIDNHQVIDAVSNTMFADTTHLNRYQGAAQYTRYLAEQYGSLIDGKSPR